MKKQYASVHANANHTPAMDNSSRFTKNRNIMKSIYTLFGRTLALRAMMTIILMFGLVCLGWGQTAGPNNAGTATNVSIGSNPNWTNPGNITNSGDANYATVSLTAGDNSDYLQGTNYGFNIPAGATINGIVVTINRLGSTSFGFGCRDNELYLVKNNVISGDNKASGTTWPTSLGTASYGSSTDKWGLSWTPSDINNANFGVALSVHSNRILSSMTPNVDYMQITVYYTTCSNSWIGTTTSTDWNVAGNWSCGSVPAPGADVIFSPTAGNHLEVPAGDKTIGNLVNNSTKALVIPTGRTLTINGTATTNSADRIVIKSAVGAANGALIFTNPASNTNVQATVEYDSKTSKPSANIYSYIWQYIGTPVSGATPISVFGSTVSGSKYGPAGSVLIRQYSEAKNDAGDVGDKWIDVDVNGAMTPFAGYEVVQQNLATDPYPFKGILRVGDFNTGNLGFTLGAYYRGNYIIANSYAAPIDISKLTAANFNNLEQTIYLYNTGSRDQWTANNYGTANIGNPGTYLAVPISTATTLGADQIPSLNGFMVRRLTLAAGYVSANPIQFNFTYASLKSGGGTTANKPMYVKAASASEKQTDTYPLLLIDVKGSNGVDRVHLITAPNTTKGFDNGWDGTKLRTQTDAQIYTFANGTDRYQVSTDSDLNGTILGFFNGTGETAFTLTFRMKDMQNVYNTLELEDLETAAKTSITDGGTFSFNASALSPESRFRINGTIATVPPIVTESPIIITYDKSKKLTVNNGSTETGSLIVYDITGNKVYETVMPVGLTYVKLKLKKGVYIVEGRTVSYKTVEKIILQ